MKCSATYIPSSGEDESWQFSLDSIDFNCPDCEYANVVIPNDISIGANITCKDCGVKFLISNQTWNYQKIVK